MNSQRVHNLVYTLLDSVRRSSLGLLSFLLLPYLLLLVNSLLLVNPRVVPSGCSHGRSGSDRGRLRYYSHLRLDIESVVRCNSARVDEVCSALLVGKGW